MNTDIERSIFADTKTDDWGDTREAALLDLLDEEPDHYARWGIVQDVREEEQIDAHAVPVAAALHARAEELDVAESLTRRGLAS